MELTVDPHTADKQFLDELRARVCSRNQDPTVPEDELGRSHMAVFLAINPETDPGGLLAYMKQHTTTAVMSAIGQERMQHRRRYDVEKIRTSLAQLAQIPEQTERQSGIREMIEGIWQQGYEHFYSFLQALSQTPFPVPHDQPEMGLMLENECYVIAIQVSQNSPEQAEEKHEGWTDFLKSKIPPGPRSQPNAWSAGLPALEGKTARFLEWIKASRELNGNYDQLLATFKRICGEIWGDRYEGYRTNGTSEAYEKWSAHFFAQHPRARIIGTNHEYGEMMYKSAGHDQRNTDFIDLGDEPQNITEAEVAKRFETQIRAQLALDPDSIKEPYVCLVSTELRNGKRRFDIPLLVSNLRQIAAQNNMPNIHIWLDGAQDSRLFTYQDQRTQALDRDGNQREENPDLGDVIFYSKRVGGTGGGLAVINKEKYPIHFSREDHVHLHDTLERRRDLAYQAFDAGGGIKPETFANLIAELTVKRGQIAHTIPHLLELPELWYYRGGGQYVNSEFDRAQTTLDYCNLVQTHFHWNPENTMAPRGEWNAQRMLNLELKAESEVNMSQLQAYLIDIYGPGNAPDIFTIEHNTDLWAELERDLQAAECGDLSGLLTFQNFHATHLSELLVTPREAMSPNTIDWALVRSRIRRNSFIRIYVSALSPTGGLPTLIEHIERGINDQIGS